MSDFSTFSILGINPGHDGAIAHIVGDKLIFSYENEKDNGHRYSEVNSNTFIKALSACTIIPDVIASGGWTKGSPTGDSIDAGYTGIESGYSKKTRFLTKEIDYFTSTHERSHILSSYAMSPFKQGQPCYALVWEGHIAAFYKIDEHVNIVKLADVLPDPGVRYAFLYGLADPTFTLPKGGIRLSDAGKLMAIAAYAEGKVDIDGASVIERILSPNITGNDLCKEDFIDSRYYNCGINNPDFANLAQLMSDSLFNFFEQAARKLVEQPLPLLISGGCALNCEWNSRWKKSTLFSSVFVPPCANDSGSAIGTAVDAMLHFTGNAKLEWSVYAGEMPISDTKPSSAFSVEPYSPHTVATHLSKGLILGWVKGRYEIGPRALGARSILACPRTEETLRRLNRIKRRESFRPIAPLCIEEDMERYFQPADKTPYMLEFCRVISDKIPAVTHVDQSARPQSVSKDDLPELYELLISFRHLTGISVLCNTSLNFNGFGFINRLSDLEKFSLAHGLDGFVFEDRLFLKKT